MTLFMEIDDRCACVGRQASRSHEVNYRYYFPSIAILRVIFPFYIELNKQFFIFLYTDKLGERAWSFCCFEKQKRKKKDNEKIPIIYFVRRYLLHTRYLVSGSRLHII